MTEAIADTAIFIDYLKAHDQARRVVAGLRADGPTILHAVAAAELIAGARNRRELRSVTNLRRTCELLVPDESDFRRALVLFERHALTHGVDWNDCLIGATCLRLGLHVVTTNDKHFRPFRGLRVIRPY